MLALPADTSGPVGAGIRHTRLLETLEYPSDVLERDDTAGGEVIPMERCPGCKCWHAAWQMCGCEVFATAEMWPNDGDSAGVVG